MDCFSLIYSATRIFTQKFLSFHDNQRSQKFLALYSTAMLRKLKPKLQFSSKNACPNMQLLELSNFQSEQQSNDYISLFCKQQCFRQALEAFHSLVQNSNFKIIPSTYAHLFSACSSLRSLEHDKKVHNHLQMTCCQPDVVLHNHMINMYGECGSLRDAQMVFDVMPERIAVSWTSLIAGYSQNQQEKAAMTLYLDMLRSGFMPDNYTLESVIKACTSTGDINLGRQLHTHLVKSTSDSCLIAHNALISMYAKFGQIVDASTIFSRISCKDLTSWGSMISGLSQLGFTIESLHYFKEMLHCGYYIPNEFIFGSTISACSSLLQPECGRQIHGVCMKSGFGNDVFVGCFLNDMYAKCGFLDSAKPVFDEALECPDIVSWNSIITGLAYHGNANEAV